MSTETDDLAKELFEEVKKKKDAIKKLEKPDWKTHCLFGFDEDNNNTKKQLHIITDLNWFVKALAFLLEKSKNYQEAAKLLGVKTEFKWCTHSLKDWQSDFQTRIDKIQISKKKDQLSALEDQLATLISPEHRRKLELEEIKKQLSNED